MARSRRGRSGVKTQDFGKPKEGAVPDPPQVEDVDAEAVLKEEADAEESVQPPPPPPVPDPPTPEEHGADVPSDASVPDGLSDDIKRLYGISSKSDDVGEDVDAEESVQPDPPADAGGEGGGDGADIPVDPVQPGQPVSSDVSEHTGGVDASSVTDEPSDPDGGGTKGEGNGGGDAGKKPRGKRPRRSWPPDDPAERDAWFDKDLKALDKKAADLGKTLLLVALEDATELKKECTTVEKILHDLADMDLLSKRIRENVGHLAEAPEETCYTLSDLRGMSLAELAKLLED